MSSDIDAELALDWHFTLIGLAGRLSDEVMTAGRSLLADHRPEAVASLVAASVLDEGVPLAEAELDLLAELVDAETAERLEQVEIVDPDPRLRYGFTAGPPTDEPMDASLCDDAVVRAAAGLACVHGVWGVWRIPTVDDSPHPPKRVYIVEADIADDLISATREIQRGLSAVGEAHPQVEVYSSGSELPAYHRLARANGELLWARTPDPGVRIAILFDEVDPVHGPRFHPDHARVDEAEIAHLSGYLRAGEVLLVTSARLNDAVDPARGNVVPMKFRTDGVWVWSDATTYYLESHRLLPDPELVAHIRLIGPVPAPLDDVAPHRAMAALQEPVDEPARTFGP